MSNITYACTTLKTHDSKGAVVTYQAGDVVRRENGRESWSDCIILGFSDPDKHGDVYVSMARPYCYASCIGTTSPSVLTGTERFAMPASKLLFEDVVSSHPMVSASAMPSMDRPYPSEHIDLT